MNPRMKLMLSAASIVAISMSAGGAYAQEGGAEESAYDPFSTGDEIIVQARKKEESIQDTPLSVTAATGEDLRFKGIDSGERLGQTAPNLSFTAQSPSSGSNASSQIFIRGIGQTDFLPTTEPGVGVYLDGVYLARSTGSLFDFVDTSQVEVLRGPQGTLFGRNTIGGAVLVRSNEPTDEFEGAVQVTFGTDNRTDVEGFLNIPISDALATRFAFLRKDRDGYVTRLATGEDIGDDDVWAVRSTTVWDATDTLSFKFIADYTIEDENGSPMVFNSIGTGPSNGFNSYAAVVAGCPGAIHLPSTDRIVPENTDPRCPNNQWDRGPFATEGNFQTNSDFEAWGVNLTTDWDLGFAAFKSIISYRDSEYQTATDADNTPLDIFDRTNDGYQQQFSAEAQLSGELLDGALDWIVGAFYFEEEAEDINVVRFAGGGFGGVANLLTAGGLGVESLGGVVENDNVAVFAQSTYDITDRLHLTAGVRWTDENKSFRPEMLILEDVFQAAQGAVVEAGCYLVPYDIDPNDSFADSVDDWLTLFPNTLFGPFRDVSAAEGCVTDSNDLVTQTFSTSEITPHASIAYDVTDDVLAYFSYTEGFKAGGFSSRVISVGPGARPFDPEFAKTYEVGVKGQYADGRLTVNAALFRTDFSEIQIVIRQDFNPVVFNAGDATIQGFELEFEALPTDVLLLTGGLGYVDAGYDSLNQAVIDAGITLDSALPHTPELTANFSAALNIETDAAVIVPRVDWSYKGSVFFDANNNEAIAADAYHNVNLSVDVNPRDFPFSLNVGLLNATDELQRVAGNQSLTSAAAYAESTYARPRQWHLRLNYDF